MTEYAVTAIGTDRPGIAAGISRALLDLEGNIEDSQMSILGGHFAVMLIVAVPDALDAESLRARLAQVRDELGLEAVAANPVAAAGARRWPQPTSQRLRGRSPRDRARRRRGARRARGQHHQPRDAAHRGGGGRRLRDVDGAGPRAPTPTDVEAALAAVAEEAQVEVSLRELGADAL